MMEQVVARLAYVMLVENEMSLQGAIRDVIVSEPDFRLVAVCAGRSEAVAVIETMPLDIALVSLHLDDGSALDVVRAVKRFQPLCEVLVMGTADDKEDIFSCMGAGASGWLLKENLAHLDRVRGYAVLRSLAFCRTLRSVPAVGEARAAKKVQMSELSPVQGDILRCVASGLSNKEIARNLFLSSYNVDYHLRCLRKRFLVRNRAQLVMAAMTLFRGETYALT